MQAGFIKSHKQQVPNTKGSVSGERPALSPGPRLWDLMHHSLSSEDEGRPSPSLESLQSPELRAVLSTLQASSKAPSRAAKTIREKLPYFLPGNTKIQHKLRDKKVSNTNLSTGLEIKRLGRR